MIAALARQAGDGTRTLVDELLEEQRALTAVERFSRLQDGWESPTRPREYRALLPASVPGSGEQYAFEVILDKCSGCKACVTACHALNGLDDTETWRSVGMLIGGTESQPYVSDVGWQQHITTACHHCADPGCLNGCPVLAYDKDPVTGIVRHLDDQCIGCSYCVMKCPYDVPKYSRRLGIVRKCDMCSNRLAVGEAPACVQACPNEAIRITVVGSETERSSRGLLSWNGEASHSITPSFPSFPDPSITRPTTRYVTQRPEVALLHAADRTELRPAQGHPPLSLMLVLTQLGVGVMAVAVILDPRSAFLAWLALGSTATGLLAATLHLGQPLKAWRGFLGWKRSWLSRELLVFGMVIGVMSAHVLLRRPETAWIALLTGMAAIVCSAMIYVDTRRAFWSARFTFPKFILTSALLGAAGALMFSIVLHDTRVTMGTAVLLMAVTLGKLGLESSFVAQAVMIQPGRLSLGEVSASVPFKSSDQADGKTKTSTDCEWDQISSHLTPLRFTQAPNAIGATAHCTPEMLSGTGRSSVLLRSALLHTRVYRGWFLARCGSGLAGGVLLPGLMLLDLIPANLATTATGLLVCLGGEMMERHLFFVCEAAPKMPGGIAQ